MSRVINESEKRITCEYGGYNGHHGIDLGWRADETQNQVHANCKGIVVECVDGLDTLIGSTGVKSWGNYVLIKHENGMKTRYAHLRKGTVKVKIGQVVDENTVLGIIGESGNTDGRHLHFEVYSSSGERINPKQYLTRAVCDNKPTNTGDITYQVYDNVKGQWLPEVVNFNDYAGNLGHNIGGIRAKCKNGKIYIQTHSIGFGWNSVVSSDDYRKNSDYFNSYSGIINNNIDMIKIWSDYGEVDYQAYADGVWLDVVNSKNVNNGTADSYAGIVGRPIQAIRMK